MLNETLGNIEKTEKLKSKLYQTLEKAGLRKRNWTSIPGAREINELMAMDDEFFGIEVEARPTENGINVVIRCPIDARHDNAFVKRRINTTTFLEAREQIEIESEEDLERLTPEILRVIQHGIAISEYNQKTLIKNVFPLDKEAPDLKNGDPRTYKLAQKLRAEGRDEESIKRICENHILSKKITTNLKKAQNIAEIMAITAIGVGATMGFEGINQAINDIGITFSDEMAQIIERLIELGNTPKDMEKQIAFRVILPALSLGFPAFLIREMIIGAIEKVKQRLEKV